MLMKSGKIRLVLPLLLVMSLLAWPGYGASWAWNTWREGFENFDQAEHSSVDGHYKEALAQYRKALVMFQQINQKSPNWNSDIIEARIRLCQRRIESLKEKVMKEEKTERDLPAEVTEPKIVEEVKPVSGSSLASVPLASVGERALRRELADCRAKLNRAVEQLDEVKKEADRNRESADAVTRLVKEKYALETEMESLRKQIAAKKASPAPTEESFDLKEQLLKAKIQTDELSRDNRDLKQQNALLEEQKAKLQKLCHSAVYEQKQLEEKNANQDDSIKRLQEKIAAVEIARKDAENQLVPLQDEKKQLQLALDKKFKAYEDLSKQLQDLRRQSIGGNGAAGKQVSADVVAENAKLRKQADAANEQVDKTAAQLEKVRKTMARLEAERKRLSDTLSDQSKTKVQSSSDFARLVEKNRGLMADLERQQQQLGELQQKNLGLSKDLKLMVEKYNTEVVKTREDLQRVMTIENTSQQYEDQLTALKRQLQETLQKNDQLQKNIAGQDRLLVDRGSELTELHRKLALAEQQGTENIAKAAKDLQTWTQRNAELTKQLTAAELRRQNAEKETEAIKKQLQNWRNQSVSTADADKLKKELDGVKKQHAQSLSDLAETRKKLDALNRDFQTLKQQHETAAKQWAEQKQSLQAQPALRKELASAREGLTQAQKQVSASTQQCTDLKQQLTDSQRQVTALQKELEKLRQQSARKNTAALAAWRQEKKQMEQQVVKLNDDNGKLRLQVTEQQQRSTTAVTAEQKQLASVQDENKRLTGQLAVVGTKDVLVKQLQDQLAALKKQLAAADRNSAAMGKVREQQQNYEREIATLKKTVATLEANGRVKAEQVSHEKTKTIVFLMEAAKNSQKQKDWESALWHYRKVIALDPDNFSAQFQTGEILLMEKQYAEAEKHLQAALKINQYMPDAVLALAECLVSRKVQNAEVDDLLHRAEVLVPEHARLKLIRALAALNKNDRAAAEKWLRAVPAQTPWYGAAQLQLARMLASDPARRREAIDLYRKASDAGAEPDNELEKLLINQ